MINVLTISNSYPNPTNFNAGIFVHEQVKSLNNSECNIKVINPLPLPFMNSFKGDVEVPNMNRYENIEVFHPKYRFVPSKYGYAFSVKQFEKAISRQIDSITNSFIPDIIHAHWATASGYAAVMLGEKLNIPVVCTLRGSDIYYYPFNGHKSMEMTRVVLNNSSRIITVSNALKKEAKKMNKGNNIIQVIYNGVNLDSFWIKSKNQIENKILNMRKSNEIILLFVGTIKKEKGIWELLEAMKLLSERYSNLKLFFVGEGNEKNKATKYCYDNNLDDKIIFLGKKRHEELVDWYNLSDIVVLPSYSEGLPNVLVEASACGKPVIASNVGGISEIITEMTGLLVEPKNLDSLKNAIVKMIEDKYFMTAYKPDTIRDFIVDKFDRDNATIKLVELYKSVIECNRKNIY